MRQVNVYVAKQRKKRGIILFARFHRVGIENRKWVSPSCCDRRGKVLSVSVQARSPVRESKWKHLGLPSRLETLPVAAFVIPTNRSSRVCTNGRSDGFKENASRGSSSSLCSVQLFLYRQHSASLAELPCAPCTHGFCKFCSRKLPTRSCTPSRASERVANPPRDMEMLIAASVLWILRGSNFRISVHPSRSWFISRKIHRRLIDPLKS